MSNFPAVIEQFDPGEELRSALHLSVLQQGLAARGVWHLRLGIDILAEKFSVEAATKIVDALDSFLWRRHYATMVGYVSFREAMFIDGIYKHGERIYSIVVDEPTHFYGDDDQFRRLMRMDR